MRADSSTRVVWLLYAEGVGPLGELGALFNPGMRHEIEERKSKANRREEEGNARDGDLRIDLSSGVAVINVPVPSAEHSTELPADQPEPDATAPAPSTIRRTVPGTVSSVRSPRSGPKRSGADDSHRSDRRKTAGPAVAPAAGQMPLSKASRTAR
jgi:hypothetical protein